MLPNNKKDGKGPLVQKGFWYTTTEACQEVM